MNATSNDKFDFRQDRINDNDNHMPSAAGLELFAEELPTQHDLAPTSTKSTTSTISTGGGCAGTVSTIACFF